MVIRIIPKVYYKCEKMRNPQKARKLFSNIFAFLHFFRNVKTF